MIVYFILEGHFYYGVYNGPAFIRPPIKYYEYSVVLLL